MKSKTETETAVETETTAAIKPWLMTMAQAQRYGKNASSRRLPALHRRRQYLKEQHYQQQRLQG
jgi:hypothetical protein